MSSEESLNFIEQFIEDDLKEGKNDGRIHTRFPPEPNGFLHIGHAKAICINFETAKKYGGKTNLRFDDTNPVTEKTDYVDAIKADIKWLGFEWHGEALFASDYFDTLFEYAVKLINKGLAYVDDSTAEEIAELKKTPFEPGVNSPYRSRSIDENLELFHGMKNGEFEDGAKVLRLKIDMASPNMLMRDPVIYRIKRAHHHRTGDRWIIYPMYDFAHGQSDSIEGITHSLCSLEFKNHRPLYDWCIQNLEIFPSRQIEFARMNVEYMITSKRKLLKLVEGGVVTGWDDPRMPTISGLRRRGYPAAAIRNFCEKVGVAKRDNLIDIALLEFCVRESLNKTSIRVMVVMDPIKVIITNFPDGRVEMMTGQNNPEDEQAGDREIPFSREIWIDRKDFMKDPPKKYFRLGPGRNVRLKHAYILNCEGFEEDASGNVTEIHCTYYPDSKSGSDTSGVKAKGTLHWVSVDHAADAEINLYDRLFTDPTPASHEDRDFLEFVNPESKQTSKNAKLEPYLKHAQIGDQFQFIRTGYFNVDITSKPEQLVFNRTITMRDTWAKKNAPKK